MSDDLREEIAQLQREMFFVHSLGYLMGSYYYEAVDAGKIKNDLAEVSNPLISISDMIMEKAEKCLKLLSVLEEREFCLNKGSVVGIS